MDSVPLLRGKLKELDRTRFVYGILVLSCSICSLGYKYDNNIYVILLLLVCIIYFILYLLITNIKNHSIRDFKVLEKVPSTEFNDMTDIKL